mmetsp:Transcript_69042/g.162446  ORF Transcript_69042/g.162446 Transcript_69042/m.162446 type:complete len:305 (-) Transcript_69042:160-1074(-)
MNTQPLQTYTPLFQPPPVCSACSSASTRAFGTAASTTQLVRSSANSLLTTLSPCSAKVASMLAMEMSSSCSVAARRVTADVSGSYASSTSDPSYPTSGSSSAAGDNGSEIRAGSACLASSLATTSRLDSSSRCAALSVLLSPALALLTLPTLDRLGSGAPLPPTRRPGAGAADAAGAFFFTVPPELALSLADLGGPNFVSDFSDFSDVTGASALVASGERASSPFCLGEPDIGGGSPCCSLEDGRCPEIARISGTVKPSSQTSSAMEPDEDESCGDSLGRSIPPVSASNSSAVADLGRGAESLG